ncbi:hypothetical protein [Salinigranum halophilum]|uniref:hypothetical protein n=1 Tax=Salinigranum halophilum TaxID=2565931 RepID=UPI00115E15AC|nr:hypothetical protein [Salinigranum halophilum]
MPRKETTTVFAGVDGRADAQLPDWYAAQTDVEQPAVVSFAEAIRDLPRAVETQVAYHNPYTDSWVKTSRFNALVEPSRLVTREQEQDNRPTHLEPDGGTTSSGSPATEDGHTVSEDALFHIPTQSYSVINPSDVYAPLERVLRETTIDSHALGDVVFGEIRQYRGGGEVHMDVMFDGLSVELPARRDPITMGLSSGYDFFGGHAVYVEGFARDTTCANSIRSLTDRETVKHVGDVGGFGTWWGETLTQLELVANDLYEFIVDAQELTVDFAAMPFSVESFYELLGFPEYLSKRAASDANVNTADPFEIDFWTLHSGATYALTHFFTGKEGSALDGYVRTANDLLFNPETTLETVKQSYERRAESETKRDGQTGIESQAALASLQRVSQDIETKAASFERREETLRARLARPESD